MTSAYDFVVEKPSGEEFDLKEYIGKPLLIVNTASHCGFAPQFRGLQNLYDKYKDDGLVVLGFPCGQFKDQEFDDIKQTIDYCQLNYSVTFPMFAKIDVNGEQTHPLYVFLKSQQNGLFSDKIKWNFTKFLVDSEGQVIKRFAPKTKPEKIEEDIKEILHTI